jgi:hypothetical protein
MVKMMPRCSEKSDFSNALSTRINDLQSLEINGQRMPPFAGRENLKKLRLQTNFSSKSSIFFKSLQIKMFLSRNSNIFSSDIFEILSSVQRWPFRIAVVGPEIAFSENPRELQREWEARMSPGRQQILWKRPSLLDKSVNFFRHQTALKFEHKLFRMSWTH